MSRKLIVTVLAVFMLAATIVATAAAGTRPWGPAAEGVRDASALWGCGSTPCKM